MIDNLEKATFLAKKEKCNLVIGIGGGSPLDVAKTHAIESYLSKSSNEITDSLRYNPRAVAQQDIENILKKAL